MNQYINVKALKSVLHAISRDPRLFLPHEEHQSVIEINFEKLKAIHGVGALVFDKDNTLTLPIYSDRLCIFSNSIGDAVDAQSGYAKAIAYEMSLGVPILRHQHQKPESHFEDIANRFRLPASHVAIIGDRYFTDILFGNINGMYTIRVAPIDPGADNFIVRGVRKFEEWYVRKLRNRGIAPPALKRLADDQL